MVMRIDFSNDLRDWLVLNLERGCNVASLLESMVAQKFEAAAALGLIGAFVEARSRQLPAPRDFVVVDDVDPAGYRHDPPTLPPGALIRTRDREVSVLLRLEEPELAVLGDVLSARECEELIALARPRLQPSTVVDVATGRDVVAPHRASHGMFFRPQETALIARLDRRLADLMNCPLEHGEGLQVLRYLPGGMSAPHFDFLVPSNPANQASLARSGQRVASLVTYLNDVDAGGETSFPACRLSVVPRRGHAVYFHYANSAGQVDEKSVHASVAVGAGEKWVATKWVRARKFVSQ